VRITSSLVAKLLYAVFGIAYLLAGIAVVSARSGMLPRFAMNFVHELSHGSSNTLHVAQELGSLLIFAGLITLWFIRHYEQSGFFHWSMTIFLGVFALVHWYDIRGNWDSATGPLITTIPFALFLLVGIWRANSPGR
jgi:hypothetical protein